MVLNNSVLQLLFLKLKFEAVRMNCENRTLQIQITNIRTNKTTL